MRWYAPLALLAVIAGGLCAGSLAQGQLWYYCSASHEFYPHVQQCSVPWRAVHPYSPVPLGQPRNIVPQPEQPEGAEPEQAWRPGCWRTCPGATTERPEGAEPEQAPITPVQTPEEAQAAAQAQAQAEAERRAEFEHERAIAKAKERGYELIPSVEDLILDGKDLAAREAKIQITGYYRKFGEGAEALYESIQDAYADDDNKFPILTDDAQRDLRKYLMNAMCETAIGCEVEVGGHVTTCKHLSSLMADYPEQPCLHVEVQIIYRPGD